MINIYQYRPINGTAGIVTSQHGCFDGYDMTRDELANRITYLIRKRRLINRILGITNARQKKNLMRRYNKKGRKVAGHKQPRILREYIDIGESIQKMQKLLSE